MHLTLPCLCIFIRRKHLLFVSKKADSIMAYGQRLHRAVYSVLGSTLAITRCILRSAIKLESVINLTITVTNLVQERPAWLSTAKAPTNCETEQSQQTLPPLNWIFPQQAPNSFHGRSRYVRNHPFPCPVTPLSFFLSSTFLPLRMTPAAPSQKDLLTCQMKFKFTRRD